MLSVIMLFTSLSILNNPVFAEESTEMPVGIKTISSFVTSNNQSVPSKNIFPKYDSIFTKYPKLKAQINEDAGKCT